MPRESEAHFFSKSSLTFRFFGPNTPGFVLGWDHFARVESSRDQNLTMFILHFHVFLHFRPLEKLWKSKVSLPPSNQGFLGQCPDDRAQKSVQDSLHESSVRPNPSLVFSKILFKFYHFWTPQYRPQNKKKQKKNLGSLGYTGRRKGKSKLDRFVFNSNTNRTNWDFHFFRSVGLLRPLEGGFLGLVLGGTGRVKIDKIWKVFLKKLGSDLVVQSSR